LPVAVLPAAISPHAVGFAGTLGFRHSSSDATRWDFCDRDYRNSTAAAQVTNCGLTSTLSTTKCVRLCAATYVQSL
jgi:hypothetical protein